MATKTASPAPVEVPAWTDEEIKNLEGLAKAERFWKADEAQVALRDSILEELSVRLEGVRQKTYAPAWDVDRLYLGSTGPDAADPVVREIALRLREGGCKAHAVAFLLGIPPRFVSGMWAGATKARSAAPVAVAEVA